MDYDAVNKVGEYSRPRFGRYDDELGLGHAELEALVGIPDGKI